jgi:hypothetical protein
MSFPCQQSESNWSRPAQILPDIRFFRNAASQIECIHYALNAFRHSKKHILSHRAELGRQKNRGNGERVFGRGYSRLQNAPSRITTVRIVRARMKISSQIDQLRT